MSVQKQRHTKGRRDRARVNLRLKKKSLVKCTHCGAMIVAHTACSKCGYYKGKEVVDTMKKINKKAKKK
ncbi:MAG: 50S ribosomal protein L32 [Parcubacteria group bacterium]|jgi:large subunit ribosomal protein L32